MSNLLVPFISVISDSVSQLTSEWSGADSTMSLKSSGAAEPVRGEGGIHPIRYTGILCSQLVRLPEFCRQSQLDLTVSYVG